MLFCMGFLFLGVGIALLVTNLAFIKKAVRVEGQVCDITQHRSSRGGRMYGFSVEFETPEGETRKFTNPASSSIMPKDGRVVGVYYLASDPSKAKLDSLFQLYLIPVIVGVPGLLLILALLIRQVSQA